MRDEKLISVIVPIYNVEKYIHKCVDSIINQTYKNLEIILVDDGSPDNCGKICDEYAEKDSRIKVIHKENGGVAEARNTGLDNAKGEWIAFIDSDDWIDNDYYETLQKNITDDIDCIIFGYRVVGEEKIDIKTPDRNKIAVCSDNFEGILGLVENGFFGLTFTKIIKRDTIDNIRFKNISLREDFCFMYECMKHIEKIQLLDYSGYNYYQNENSILHTRNISHVEDLRILSITLQAGIDSLTKEENDAIFQYVMKIALQDVIIKDIVKNNTLSKQEKIISLMNICKNGNLGKIKHSNDDGKLLCIYYLVRNMFEMINKIMRK